MLRKVEIVRPTKDRSAKFPEFGESIVEGKDFGGADKGEIPGTNSANPELFEWPRKRTDMG